MNVGSLAFSVLQRGTALAPCVVGCALLIEAVMPIALPHGGQHYVGGAALASPAAIEHVRREHTETSTYQDHPYMSPTRGTAEIGTRSFNLPL